MTEALRRIPKIPKKALTEATKKPVKVKEFSGNLDGGTLWQVLGVEENLVRRILHLLGPVDLINLEQTSAYIRDLVIQFNVWKDKFNRDFRKMDTLVDIAEKLEETIEKADEANAGNVLKSEHWLYKLKYVHCWNLEKNWNNGQYVFMENKLSSQEKSRKNCLWKNMDQHILLSTKHTAYKNELYCHRNNIRSDNIGHRTVPFYGLYKLMEVSDKHLLLFVISEEGFKTLLMEKNSLEVLATCFFSDFFDNVGFHQCPIALLDESSCLVVINNDISSDVCVVKFMLDTPKIWIEEIQIDECLRICSVRGPYSVGFTDFKLEVLHFDLTNVSTGGCSSKVWEKDISQQNSFPKIKYLSAYLNFPFIYVSKSNGLLDVWDFTKDEVVKTIDKTDILGSQQELKPGYIEENMIDKVMCLNSPNDIVVLNGKFMKSGLGSSNNIGFRLNGIGGVNRAHLFIDNTCIAGQSSGGLLCKFDFWPIYPGNFKLKSAKPEVEKKPKKRKRHFPESVGMTSKSMRVESESDYSDEEDEYNYHEEEMYNYGDDRYEDHDQFYDDDNFVDDY